MEKMDLVLEATYHKFKSAILEESTSQEETQRYTVVITEAASSIERVKQFVKENKGKLAALAALAAAGGAGYAAKQGMLGEKAKELADSTVEGVKNILPGSGEQQMTEKEKAALEKTKEALAQQGKGNSFTEALKNSASRMPV